MRERATDGARILTRIGPICTATEFFLGVQGATEGRVTRGVQGSQFASGRPLADRPFVPIRRLIVDYASTLRRLFGVDSSSTRALIVDESSANRRLLVGYSPIHYRRNVDQRRLLLTINVDNGAVYLSNGEEGCRLRLGAGQVPVGQRLWEEFASRRNTL